MSQSIDKYIRTRPTSAYPKSINDEIKMISFNRKSPDAKIYGSFSYIIQKYAADIDTYEVYYPKGTADEAINKFEKELIIVVNNIIKKKYHWFSEYKTGMDKRYDVDIGTMTNGRYTISPRLYLISKNMYENKLLNKKELDLIKKCINKNKKNPNDSDVYDVIYNIFRERKILRWTQKEILSKKKLLPGGIYITLKDALRMKGHVKIDEIIYVNGKFLEITNFVFLGNKTNEGKVSEHYLNIPKLNRDIIISGLKDEVEKLYLSNFYYSPFKVVKRIFALSRYIFLTEKNKEYEKYLKKMIPFVSSDASYLYQIKSELEAILRIFDVSKNYPKVTINRQIENLKLDLSNIVDLDNEDINELNNLIDKIVITKHKKVKKELIKNLIDKIKFVVNYMTINYFNSIDFNPPPKEFYNKPMKYKLIKRLPYEQPAKKSKLIQLYKKL